LEIGIAVIQLFDIGIHAATNQLEILRVSSNIIVLLWVVIVVSGKFESKFLPIAASFIGAYLVLNLIFIALFGVTATTGGPRVALFVMVFLTTTLSILLVSLFDRR